MAMITRVNMATKLLKDDKKWKEELTPEQYEVTRKKGTEPPFSGEYVHNKDKGVYKCVCCGNTLFSSDDKYESGTGWPSFTKPIAPDHVQTKPDKSLFMERTELLCSVCDAHLGHVFDDGVPPTGKRFCVNSASLDFEKKE